LVRLEKSIFVIMVWRKRHLAVLTVLFVGISYVILKSSNVGRCVLIYMCKNYSIYTNISEKISKNIAKSNPRSPNLTIIFYCSSILSTFDASTKTRPLVNHSQERKSCAPLTHIFFLKLHKCGSSTLQNILMRLEENTTT
jgi:Galactose-3-O-sulfotransferase